VIARARTWRDVLAQAAGALRAAGVEDSLREAQMLLADALGTDKAGLIAREQDACEPAAEKRLQAMIARRVQGEPISRIRGWKDFYGRVFQITADVLDPRPDTETLVEAGLARLPARGRVLDLGVGSGCVLVSLLAERPDASGVGVDVSPAALVVAQANAGRLGVLDRATWIEGGWAVATGLGTFDVVVSNPPYIPTGEIPMLDREVREQDPGLALDGGADGLCAYRAIVPVAMGALADGGWLVLEVGAGQAGEVAALLSGEGFADICTRRDLGGHERVVEGRRPRPGER
jgi:release factor glutamine methyltransferase